MGHLSPGRFGGSREIHYYGVLSKVHPIQGPVLYYVTRTSLNGAITRTSLNGAGCFSFLAANPGSAAITGLIFKGVFVKPTTDGTLLPDGQVGNGYFVDNQFFVEILLLHVFLLFYLHFSPLNRRYLLRSWFWVDTTSHLYKQIKYSKKSTKPSNDIILFCKSQ